MSVLTPVLHTGLVCGKAVRFLRSPSPSPDLPWHAVDDLHLALGFPRDLRRQFAEKLRKGWSKDVRTVATSKGIVTAAPHFMAKGMIGAAEEVGCGPYTADVDYSREAAEAMKLLAGDLHGQAFLDFVLAAARKGGGE
jgi:hypothetical protein